MVFLPIICLGLAILFTVRAVRGDEPSVWFAICLYLAALGTGVISYLALSVLKMYGI